MIEVAFYPWLVINMIEFSSFDFIAIIDPSDSGKYLYNFSLFFAIYKIQLFRFNSTTYF